MKIIAITTPKMIDEDAYLISNLLKLGIYSIHLRKPEATIHECQQLLSQLTDNERAKIIIHDYPELYTEFSLKGIHINKNITSLPNDYNGFKTRSCHSFEEIKRYKNEYDYLFLSPIFDSISKVGYKSAFTKEELLKVSTSGLIDHKIIALGGITLDMLPYFQELNFGGIAMIGGIYNTNTINNLTHHNPYPYIY
ncbi:MAG: thiamine phosphate synthase [Paludibacteraceae bacterium]|nr:thiamine phosphate synthase [Paludibacteraceae bacterium]